ncbi:hypothetical protein TSAR_011920 [Trichomalopsis sarcophagae]|uniref:Uncharacterized protein n=1 Tax=Trichomalopsis sarcophagae TaxID=543379 RepID=A0A232F234_9HYME|nr:hypothetical protein TSAR_011920 [Trichomalopsis sarcophagae]
MPIGERQSIFIVFALICLVCLVLRVTPKR